MDDFSLGAEVIDPIMTELEVVNRLLGGYSVFYDALETLKVKGGMTISDWGCGGGDSLRQLAAWSSRRNLNLKFIGVDATESAVEFAKKKAASYPNISFVQRDVFDGRFRDKEFDLVISSLFTHHFKEHEWIDLVRRMYECCSYAVVINDLHRHWFAYHSISILTSLFSRSEMVKHDSKVSVLRGFRRSELEDMLKKAGITRYTIKWKWAFRWQIIIHK